MVLLEGFGKGWVVRVFYFDNGLIVIEVGLKMVFCKFYVDVGFVFKDGN